ncbi:MAG: integrase family protein [Magnetococcales bacterium]|nr:integrase family protein [Magnetococcales bacterium]
MRLIKSAIDRLPVPDTGQVIYRDDELKGFGLRCTPGSKTFIVEKRVSGKVKRITLGRYGELTAEQARKEAQRLLGEIAQGHDPIGEEREATLKAKTLGAVFEDYLAARKDLKPKTLIDYRRVLRLHFSDWMEKPFVGISKDMVEKRHAKIGTGHGQAYANLGMRLLRALFNFAAGKYEDEQGRSLLPENPVKRLSQTRAWYRVERRQTIIKPHELKTWYQGVMTLENATMRDYLLTVILTGLRREEAARLRWENVDLAGRSLTIPDTKNHDPLHLPLGDYLMALLTRRKSETGESPFVFPGGGVGGHLVEPRAQMAKVTEQTGVSFSVHDMRRTFITMAESLDISSYAIKGLVNHRIKNADVTGGYIVFDVERLREPMTKIETAFLRWMGAIPSAEIIPFQSDGLSRAKG